MLSPYLGERELYEQFKLSEPWDGPNNKKLLRKMPKVFAPPGVQMPQPFSTFYRVFVSPKPKDGRKGREAGGPLGGEVQAAFVQGQQLRFPNSFTDGVENTIVIVEAGKAVPWTKPEDLPFTRKPLPELGGLVSDVFHAAYADGEAQALTKQCDEFTLRPAIASSNGEVMNFERLEVGFAAIAELRQKNRELEQDRELHRERLRLLTEERDALRGRSVAKRSPDDEANEELKKENARLQKELDEAKGEVQTLTDQILRKKTP